MLGKYGLAMYFKYAAPTSAFGAAGSLAAVLLWVYYSGFILFFGAEFTKAWALAHGHHVVPDEIAVKVIKSRPARPRVPDIRVSPDLRSRPAGSFLNRERRNAAHAVETSKGRP